MYEKLVYVGSLGSCKFAIGEQIRSREIEKDIGWI